MRLLLFYVDEELAEDFSEVFIQLADSFIHTLNYLI
jgi:hypothetical protein